ncbi:hypothetical protein ACFLQI_00385 [Candidatus Undinarchaeota archaeon]
MDKFLKKIPKEVNSGNTAFFILHPSSLFEELVNVPKIDYSEDDLKELIENLVSNNIATFYVVYDDKFDSDGNIPKTAERLLKNIDKDDSFHLVIIGSKCTSLKKIMEKVQKRNLFVVDTGKPKTVSSEYKILADALEDILQDKFDYILLTGGVLGMYFQDSEMREASINLFLKHFKSEVRIIGIRDFIRTMRVNTSEFIFEELQEYGKLNKVSLFMGNLKDLKKWVKKP